MVFSLITGSSKGPGWDPGAAVVPNVRHKLALQKGLDACLRVEKGLEAEVSPDLLAIDLQNGEHFAELWEGDGISHRLGEISPCPGDYRILTTSNESGYSRPIIWNPCTGESQKLSLDDIT